MTTLIPIVALVTPDDAREIARLTNDAPADVSATMAQVCERNGWEPAMLIAGRLIGTSLEDLT